MNRKKIKYALKQILLLISTYVFCVLINNYFVSLNKVQGVSMAPTIAQNSYVVSILDLVFNVSIEPKMGDFYIINPTGLSEKVIKRLIAGPNDQVWIDNGIVFVNGENRSALFRLPQVESTQTLRCKYFAKIQVPDKKFFFLGDNLCEALDSREFGSIASAQILGHVIYRFTL